MGGRAADPAGLNSATSGDVNNLWSEGASSVLAPKPYVASLRSFPVDRRRAPPPRALDARELADEVSERRSRALEEPLDLRLRQRDPYPLIEVRNPLHRTTYLVMRPAYPDRSADLCTCTDFARRGLGTCKHIEAADRWLANHPDASPSLPSKPAVRPGAVWKEIDRRLERAGRGSVPASLRWREAGAALFEAVP